MVIKSDFMLREIAGEYVLVPTGMAALDFGSLVSTNEVGFFIWEQLRSTMNLDELVEAVVGEFEVDEATARADTEEFVRRLEHHHILEP